MKILNSAQIEDYANQRMSRYDDAVRTTNGNTAMREPAPPKSFLSHNLKTLQNVKKRYESNKPVIFVNDAPKNQQAYIHCKPYIERKLDLASLKADAHQDPTVKTFDDDLKHGFITKQSEVLDNQYLASNSPYNHIYKKIPKTNFDHLADFEHMQVTTDHHDPSNKANVAYLNKNQQLAKSLHLSVKNHKVVDTKTGKALRPLDIWRRANHRVMNLRENHPQRAISRSDIMSARMTPVNAEQIASIPSKSPNDAMNYLHANIQGKHDPVSNSLRNYMKQMHITADKYAPDRMPTYKTFGRTLSKNDLNILINNTREDLRERASQSPDSKYNKYTIPKFSGIQGSNYAITNSELHTFSRSSQLLSNSQISQRAREESLAYGKSIARKFKNDPVLSHANIARSFTEDRQQLKYAFNMSQDSQKMAKKYPKASKQYKKYMNQFSKYSNGFNDLNMKFDYHYTQHVANSVPHFHMLSDRFDNINNMNSNNVPSKFASVNFATGHREDAEFVDGEDNAIYNKDVLPKVLNHTDHLASKNPKEALHYLNNSLNIHGKTFGHKSSKFTREQARSMLERSYETIEKSKGHITPSMIYKTTNTLHNAYNIPADSYYDNGKAPLYSKYVSPKALHNVVQKQFNRLSNQNHLGKNFDKKPYKSNGSQKHNFNPNFNKPKASSRKLKLAKIKRSQKFHR